MRKRWKKILLWIFISLFLIVGSGLFALNYAVNRVLDSLSDEAFDSLSSNEGIIKNSDLPRINSSSKSDKENQTEMENNDPETNVQSKPKNKVDKVESNQTYDPSISIEKATDVKREITLEEKTKVITIMMNKLSPSDIKLMTQLANGGLTKAEKIEAKKIILEKLTEEEYNELISIAARLGLSQGKKYNETK